MSGGYFEYSQYRMLSTIEELTVLIGDNGQNCDGEEANEYCCPYNYPPHIIKEFETGLELLKKAQIYVNRIDYLVSGDDGEESFISHLNEELEKVYEQ